MIIIHLKELLEKKGRNQRSLKLETKIRSGTINAYYHRFIRRMNIEDLNKICGALDCRIEELLEYIPDEKEPPGD